MPAAESCANQVSPRVQPIDPVSEGAITVPPEVQRRKLVHHESAVYPPLARNARVHGLVRLKILILENGSVARIEVISGHSLLVNAAREAVKRYVYEPTLVDGAPKKVWTEVVVNFP
jgi:protein TonB